jgi:hypothetical protein
VRPQASARDEAHLTSSAVGTADTHAMISRFAVGVALSVVFSLAYPISAFVEFRLVSGSVSIYLSEGHVSIYHFPFARRPYTRLSGALLHPPHLERQVPRILLPSGSSSMCLLSLPLWIPMSLSTIPTLLHFRRKYRRGSLLCASCSYPLTGLPPNSPCPECGQSVPALPDRPADCV